jgi:hypothetical protein
LIVCSEIDEVLSTVLRQIRWTLIRPSATFSRSTREKALERARGALRGNSDPRH